jgi:hypothetical protein
MVHLQPVKPNKYPACEQVYTDYYQCVLVTEVSFGKFIGRCNKAKELLDACNVTQQKLARQRNFQLAKERQAMIDERMGQLAKGEENSKGTAAKSTKG